MQGCPCGHVSDFVYKKQLLSSAFDGCGYYRFRSRVAPAGMYPILSTRNNYFPPLSVVAVLSVSFKGCPCGHVSDFVCKKYLLSSAPDSFRYYWFYAGALWALAPFSFPFIYLYNVARTRETYIIIPSIREKVNAFPEIAYNFI